MIQQDFEFTQQRVSNIEKILQIENLTPQEVKAKSQANEENMFQYMITDEKPNLSPTQPTCKIDTFEVDINVIYYNTNFDRMGRLKKVLQEGGLRSTRRVSFLKINEILTI